MKKLNLEENDINALRKVASKEYVYVAVNGKDDFVCIPATSFKSMFDDHKKFILDQVRRML